MEMTIDRLHSLPSLLGKAEANALADDLTNDPADNWTYIAENRYGARWVVKVLDEDGHYLGLL